MEYYIYRPDELTHWGIKGMRWGQRRYQNKDGSLTPAGKKRYDKEAAELKKEAQILKNRKTTKAKFDKLAAKRKALEEEKKALDEEDAKGKKTTDAGKATQKSGKKSISEMSDEELMTAINRARMEDTYRQLRPEPVNEKHPVMKKLVNDVVLPAAINGGKQALESVIRNAVGNLTKGKVDPNSLEALKKTYEKLDYKQKIDKMLNPDKYLSEEDKTKRADRGYKAEDRAAQMKGYKDAADEARAKREAEKAQQDAKQAAKDAKKAEKEAAKQAKKDAKAAKKLQEEMDAYNDFQEKYKKSIDIDSGGPSEPYRSSGGERTTVNPNKPVLALPSGVAESPVTSLSASTVSRGKTSIDSYNGWDRSVKSLDKPDSEKLMTYDEDGNFLGYF